MEAPATADSAPSAETTEITPAEPAATTNAPGDACTDPSPVLQMVIDLSPPCFQSCPQLCGALEALVAKFSFDPDPAAIEAQVCADKDHFGCAFQPTNLGACAEVLAAGATFDVPQTGAELSRRCSAAAGGYSNDVDFDEDTPMSSAGRSGPMKAAFLLFASLTALAA